MKPKMEGRSINQNSCRLSFHVLRRKARARADSFKQNSKIREVLQVDL